MSEVDASKTPAAGFEEKAKRIADDKQQVLESRDSAEQGLRVGKIGDEVTARAFIVIDCHRRISPGEKGTILEVDEDTQTYKIRWADGAESSANGDQLVGVLQER